jgi:hypothetical protein
MGGRASVPRTFAPLQPLTRHGNRNVSEPHILLASVCCLRSVLLQYARVAQIKAINRHKIGLYAEQLCGTYFAAQQ